MLLAFERAERRSQDIAELLTFVVVGVGPLESNWREHWSISPLIP